VISGLATWQLQSQRYKTRHQSVLSDGSASNPRIDADQLAALRDLALAAEGGGRSWGPAQVEG
jgi:hypothetical protein